jgi:hypothetical protein
VTGSERVRRAVLFQGPDRIPVDLPEPFGTDFLHVGPDPDPNWRPKSPGEDEWGCIWEKDREGRTMGQVKFHPLRDYSILNDYPFPNYDLPERYERARRAIEENKEGKFVLAHIPLSFIHRLEYLRGHEEAWTDPYEHPDELEMLLDKLADIAMDSIRHFASIGAEGICSADDWGLQDRSMVSPELFRRFWKKRYAKVYGFARDLGLLTFLHSCGHISELLDDLIDAGLQVIQMDQQENMGVEELSRRFGGRICFWCPVDIQGTMVRGSVEDVRRYARRLIDAFGRFNGGFIGKWYPSPDAVGHTWEKIAVMAEEFISYGSKIYKKGDEG